jgi:hypothetical protein
LGYARAHKSFFGECVTGSVSVIKDDSSADERAVTKAINPAKRNDKITEGPASPAATPLTTKMPAPIIFAIPTEAAPNNPTFRSSFVMSTYLQCFGKKCYVIPSPRQFGACENANNEIYDADRGCTRGAGGGI